MTTTRRQFLFGLGAAAGAVALGAPPLPPPEPLPLVMATPQIPWTSVELAGIEYRRYERLALYAPAPGRAFGDIVVERLPVRLQSAPLFRNEVEVIDIEIETTIPDERNAVLTNLALRLGDAPVPQDFRYPYMQPPRRMVLKANEVAYLDLEGNLHGGVLAASLIVGAA